MTLSSEQDAVLRACSTDDAAYDRLRDLFNRVLSSTHTNADSIGQRRYAALFDQSNDAVFIIDLDGRHIDVNKRAAEMLGYTRQEIRGLTFRDLVVQGEISNATTILERLLGGERIPPYQRTFRHKDGSTLPVEVNVECVFSDDDEPMYLQSIVRDIGERVALSEALRLAEERHQSIIEAMAEGVVMQGRDGSIIEANPAAQRILGMTIDQMMGRTSLDPTWHCIHEDGTPFPGEEHPAMITLHTGEPQHNEVMGVHKPNGTLTWISINSEPLFIHPEDTNPHAVVTTFTDITELQEAHLAEIKLAIQHERMNFITQFIRDVSHEFRTPLSIISTGAYFISRVDNPEKRRQHTDKILHQVDRLSALVDTLLLISRLNTEPDLAVNTVWMGTLLQQATQVLEKKRAAKDIHLDMIMPAGDVTVKADPQLLLEAFRQLLDNAIRYSSVGGEVVIRTMAHPDTVAIDIADRGMGIAEENMSRIFERFWRLDTAHTEPGFGLGLPIAQRIIHLHGGEIYIMSEVDHGTTVTVYLPINAV